jgi:hypothetical protein
LRRRISPERGVLEVCSRGVEKGKGGMITSFTQYHEGA